MRDQKFKIVRFVYKEGQSPRYAVFKLVTDVSGIMTLRVMNFIFEQSISVNTLDFITSKILSLSQKKISRNSLSNEAITTI